MFIGRQTLLHSDMVDDITAVQLGWATANKFLGFTIQLHNQLSPLSSLKLISTLVQVAGQLQPFAPGVSIWGEHISGPVSFVVQQYTYEMPCTQVY